LGTEKLVRQKEEKRLKDAADIDELALGITNLQVGSGKLAQPVANDKLADIPQHTGFYAGFFSSFCNPFALHIPDLDICEDEEEDEDEEGKKPFAAKHART
jgi:hypothetical protein